MLHPPGRSIVLTALLVLACGRTTTDDFGPRPDDGAGGATPDAGGSSSGASGGAKASGGSPAGGGDGSGGSVGLGGSQNGDCGEGTWGNGVLCEPWTHCEPGQFVLTPGTSTTDVECAPCARNFYSANEDQASCEYSGCEFSERVIEPATAMSPAKCESDPTYVGTLGIDEMTLLGLVGHETRAYAGYLKRSEFELHTYEAGARVETRVVPYSSDFSPSSFGRAPDGTIYLQGESRTESTEIVLEGYPPDGSEPWRRTFLGASSLSGIVTTEIELIHWRVFEDGGEDVFVHGRSSHPEYITAAAEHKMPLSPRALAAENLGPLWATGAVGGALVLAKMDSVSTFETVPLPEDFLPRSLAVSPEGQVYVTGTERYSFSKAIALGVGPDGSVDELAHVEAMSGYYLEPSAIAVDPGVAVYVAATTGLDDGGHSIPGADVALLRVDLSSGEISAQEFVGPASDVARFVVVTTDGAVYLAGDTDFGTFVRKAN